MTTLKPCRDQADFFTDLKIGLLGGSFNPAHQGHLDISRYALSVLGLDAVWWLVSPQNPLKQAKGMLPLAERLGRAEALLQGEKKIIASDIEDQLGTRFTVDSLDALKRVFSKTRFVWLMGSDNLVEVHKWQEWERLFRSVPIAVFRRGDYDKDIDGSAAARRFALERLDPGSALDLAPSRPPAWLVLNNPYNPLSATQIRRTLEQS